jgi:hypothetical protein
MSRTKRSTTQEVIPSNPRYFIPKIGKWLILIVSSRNP